uniref:Uncharacterized protein n=1 Tax=Fomitiporia mediterranea TaxID=208960 RepID=A0A5B9R9R3_9AGAM|nr:hypothetical protein Fomme_000092 [Fomitiporia mediterranea]QEG57102.1 hypothetical protein Fomme_000092 [Fomitiporia mediterranea]
MLQLIPVRIRMFSMIIITNFFRKVAIAPNYLLNSWKAFVFNSLKHKKIDKMKNRQILVGVAILIATSFIALYIYDFLNNADNIVNVTSNNNVVLNNHFSARTVTNVTSELNNMSNTTNSTVQQITETANSTPKWALILGFGGFFVLVMGGIALQAWGMPIIPVTEAIEMASDIEFRHST